jgi:hypothetical protein
VLPFGNVTHDTGLDADHGQLFCVFTVTVAVVASGLTVTMMGEIVYVQDPPGCETVTVCPATVTVPLRSTPVVFAATLNVARPSPGPPPLARVIHGAELDADQLQAPGVATSTPNVDAADVNATTVGDTVKLQTAPA